MQITPPFFAPYRQKKEDFFMSEKKVGKRLLTWVLVLVMTLSLLPLNVLAENSISPASILPPDTKCIVYTFYNGSEIVDKQEIKNNESLEVPATPEKEGYQFTGWFDQNGTEFTNFGIAITVTEDSTGVDLYAKFVPVCYVYFMDGKGTDARIIATKEVTATDPLNDFSDVAFPIGADEAITGWVDKDNNPVTSVSFSDGTTYLYPVVEKGHWIEFNSNGGSYVAPLFVAKNAQLSSLPEPTKHGYSFDSWYTDKEMTNKFESDNDLSDDLTLYAKWNPSSNVSYTVIHWLENADDDNYSLAASESKSGITGSKTEATAKTYVGFTSPAAKDIEQETIAGDGSTIVNVYYKRNMYEVKFSSYSYTDWRGHSHPGTEYTSLRITAKYGANISDKWPTYNGSSTWSTNDNENKGPYQVNIQTMPLGGANFYGPKTGRGSETAYYYVESLTGGKYELHHSDTTPGTGYSVTDEDRYPITGFTFKTYTAEQGGDWFDGYYEKYDGARFYYTRNSYNIVFINGGAEDKTLSKKYQQDISDANYTPTAPAGKVGYEFAGWYDNELCEGDSYIFTGKTMPAQNITVYAKWEAPTFTVTVYDADKETILKTFENVSLRRTINKDDMPTVTLADGDTFLGWTYEDGTPFNFNTAITKDIDLYARIGNKAGYSVTYVVDSSITAQETVDAQKYANNSKATVLNNLDPLPANKVFLGWTTKENDTKVEYYPNSSIEITGNVTLYAVYGDTAETVTVTYHSNFGSTDSKRTTNAMPNNGKFSVADYSALDLPDRTGYEFIGWSTKSGEQEVEFEKDDDARADKNGSNDLYAQWKSIQITDKITVTIKGNTSTVTYDGTEKSVTGYTVERSDNRYTENDFTFSGTALAKGTDAGTYPMGLKPENFENKNANFSKVTFVVTDGSLTITKRDVTLTSASASKPYDGTALTSKNVTVGGNGFADGEGATYNVTGSQTEVGKSDNEFTYELNANTKASNYNITMYKGELVITAADSVAYKVEHYKQNLDGSYNDTPNDIDPLSGTAGTLTAAAAKDYPGFTPGTVTQEKIKSDGTTTIKIQYTRNSYTLTINYVYRDGSKAAESHIETILYGKDYSVTSPKISSYTADKLVVSGTMPADNRTVTVTYTKNGGHHPRPKPTVEIEDDDALGLNTTDHFAYIVGYGNGEVRPQNNITRAEVATIFFRLLTDDVRDENLTKTNRYSDVTRADWYNTAVSTLSSMGIITGYPDGTFRPNAAITRAEFAAIAARFDNDGDKTAAKFSDIATHWAKDEISIAYNNGWITGYPDGTFGPQRDITRAETMTLVNRVLNRQPETEEDLLPNMTVWTDNANPKAWYYLAVQEATNSHYYKFKTNSKYEKWTELRETRDWTQLEK